MSNLLSCPGAYSGSDYSDMSDAAGFSGAVSTNEVENNLVNDMEDMNLRDPDSMRRGRINNTIYKEDILTSPLLGKDVERTKEILQKKLLTNTSSNTQASSTESLPEDLRLTNTMSAKELHHPHITAPTKLKSYSSQGNRPVKRVAREPRKSRKVGPVSCVLVVTFDLELGQAVECVYPDILNDEEKKSIAFLSFPDSNSAIGDTMFCFRTPTIPTLSGRHQLAAGAAVNRGGDGGKSSPSPGRLKPTKRSTPPRHYYGSVYFRQVPDSTLRRGFYQKSVVVISRYPYVGLANEIVKTIAPEYFKNGQAVLKQAIDDTAQWPRTLQPGVHELSLLGEDIRASVGAETYNSTDFLIGDLFKSSYSAVREVEVMRTCTLTSQFQYMLSDMWLIWELVLTGQPIVVSSDSPASCSEAVLGLVSLIAPLKYDCEYRPFFTIHDPNFKDWAKSINRPPRCIIGVTNPYFGTALDHWPHIIRLPATLKKTKPPAAAGGIMGSPLGYMTSKNAKGSLFAKPGLYTDLTPTLEKDRELLRRITAFSAEMPLSLAVPNSTDIDSLQRSSFGGQLADGDPSNRNASDKTKCIQILGAQNEALIKHFTHVTQSFLAPLEKYFASLIPLQKKVTAWRPIPKIQNFNKRDVLKLIATAEPHGLTLTRNADIVALYSEFMACPNFDRWLKTKVKRANEAMWTYYISQLETADVTEFMTGHSEIEAVDLILRLKEMSEMRNELITDNVVKLMRGHAETIEEGLPDDLRQSIVHR